MTEQEQTKLLKRFEEFQQEFNLLELKFNEILSQSEISSDGTNTVAISNLQNEINAINANINNLNTLIDYADTQSLLSVATNITELETCMTELETDIATLETNVNNLSQNVSSFNTILNAKQGKLIAGEGIRLNNNVISADISGKQDKLTAGENVYFVQDCIGVDLSSKQDVLTAGNGIDITDNVISATNSDSSSSLTAGDNITIEDGIISADLSSKQDILTAGNGITIENNVISSTGGGSGSGDSGDLSNITSNIQSLQSDIQSLQSQINALQTPVDPYYIGQTPSDYPAGTIFQTYDCYDQNFEMNSTGTITSPTIYFCAEAGSLGTIKVNVNFKVLLQATNVLITIKVNDVQQSQETFEVSQINTVYSYTKNLYDLNLNQTEKGNNIVVELKLSGSTSNTRSCTLTNLKVEVLAPNADILNKIYPFDAVSINDTYYISDSRTGKAKICQIPYNSITNIDSLTWTDTNIDCLSYEFCCNFAKFNTTYVVDQMGYLIKNLANAYQAYSECDGNTTNYGTFKFLNWSPSFSDTRIMFVGLNGNNSYGAFYKTLNSTNIASSTTSSIKDIVSVYCQKLLFNYDTANSCPSCAVRIDKNGNAVLATTFNNVNASNLLNLGYGTNPTLYMVNYQSINNYEIECYLKIYDKIVRNNIAVLKSIPTLISTTIIGSYEKYFRMSHNDYCVIKNNNLLYFKDNME